MAIIGLLLIVWGIALSLLARPMHENWREMVRRLRGAGFSRPPFGTRFIASPEGLRTMQVAGGAGLAIGVVLALLGWYRR